MKLLTSIIATIFLTTTTLAAQSAPFYLVLHSDNSTLDGKALFSCHEGAAIEGLCVGTSTPKPANNISSTFQFNYTHSEPNYGILTWELIGSNFKVSSGLTLYPSPSTNVALPLFEPGAGENLFYVSFDNSTNSMYVKSYLDDTVSPPKYLDKPAHLENWYVCLYNYSGYLYEVLAWVYGVAPPQNPSCQKVCVERVFLS